MSHFTQLAIAEKSSDKPASGMQEKKATFRDTPSSYPTNLFESKMDTARVKSSIKILVLDIDACAITNRVGPRYISNTRADMISPSLIKHVESSKFDGFYLCTHRCLMTTFEVAFDDNRLQQWAESYSRFNPKNITTTMIVQNLQKALGIPCVAVSTPDDFSHTAPIGDPLEQCGYGFRNLIAPYEADLMRVNHDLIAAGYHSGYRKTSPLESLHHSNKNPDGKSKNKQLILVGQHAATVFSDRDIQLYYRDDQADICKAASKISSEDLAENVTLYITQDAPLHGTVKDFGSIKGSGCKSDCNIRYVSRPK